MSRADTESCFWEWVATPEGELSFLLDSEGELKKLEEQLEIVDAVSIKMLADEEVRRELWQFLDEEVDVIFVEWWAVDDRGEGRPWGFD